MKRIALFAAYVALASGCGVDAGTHSTGEDSGFEDVGSVEQAIAPDDCGLLTPNEEARLTITSASGAGSFAEISVNPPYRVPACPNFAPVRFSHAGIRATASAAYAGPLPTNQRDCEGTRVTSIVFSTTGTALGPPIGKRGVWVGTQCSYPLTGHALPPGQHRIWAQAVDRLGQVRPVRVRLIGLR